jgi:hypothetical protein
MKYIFLILTFTGTTSFAQNDEAAIKKLSTGFSKE